MKVNKKKKGFTLIELIVVIAILGILAAVLIPKFTGFQQKAKGTKALVDAKNVATAIDAFQIEHSLYPKAANQDEIEKTAGIATPTTLSALDGSGVFTVTYTDPGDSKVYQAGRTTATGPVQMISIAGVSVGK